jgi:cystathionine beta-lyase
LNNHPKVKTVYYPGLPSDPFHEIAKSKCVVLAEWFFNFVSGKKEDAIDFLKNKNIHSCRIFRWSRVTGKYSVMMAHASIPEDKRKKLESPMI